MSLQIARNVRRQTAVECRNQSSSHCGKQTASMKSPDAEPARSLASWEEESATCHSGRCSYTSPSGLTHRQARHSSPTQRSRKLFCPACTNGRTTLQAQKQAERKQAGAQAGRQSFLVFRPDKDCFSSRLSISPPRRRPVFRSSRHQCRRACLNSDKLPTKAALLVCENS